MENREDLEELILNGCPMTLDEVNRRRRKFTVSTPELPPLPADILDYEYWEHPELPIIVLHGADDGEILEGDEILIEQVHHLLREGGVLVCCNPAAVKARYPALPVLWPDHSGPVYTTYREGNTVVFSTEVTVLEVARAFGEEVVEAIWDEMFQPRPRSRHRRAAAPFAPSHRGHRSGYKPPKR